MPPPSELIGAFGTRRAQSTLGAPGHHSQRDRFWSTVLDPPDSNVLSISGRRAAPSLMGVRCGDCGAIFRGSTELAAHVDARHRRQDRKFDCDRCASQFSQSSHLNQHIRAVHQHIRPFRCAKCNRSFGKRFDLESHYLAVHENYRPYICPVPTCARPFSKRSNCKRHVINVHPTHTSNSILKSNGASSVVSSSTSKRHRRVHHQ